MVMEDPAVRRTWLNTITVALFAAATAATTAQGGPLDWLPGRSSSHEPESVTAFTHAARPSENISPFWHPFKYMGATISDLPFPGRSKDKVVDTEQKADSISLSTPTGPVTPQLKIAMAQMCEQHHDIAGARHHYQDALKKWPGQVDVLRAAARMEDRLGQLQLAENLYQQAIAANPQQAGAHNDLGMCLARQGKFDASVHEIEEAVHMEPSNQRYRNNAAVVLVQMRQDQRALAHLSAAHPPADANFNLGQLLVQQNRPMDAAQYFSTALELNPSMQPAHDALVKLQSPAVGQIPTGPSSAPVAGPRPSTPVAPQQASPVGPQMSFPETARSPASGASSYVPPSYYAPRGQVPPRSVPRVSQAPPRYLPPVQPGPQPQRTPMGILQR
jgi:Tfp pilus assembly protein PilF